MRPTGPTFWPLDGRLGWRMRERLADDTWRAVGDAPVIRLAADPDGPLSLNSPDGSLGGLLPPRGMAVDDDGLLYLLETDAPFIRRFDPASHRFIRLPEVGGEGTAARRFHAPTNVAMAGRNLYVADTGNRRVQVFATDTWVLKAVWGSWGEGDPADVTATGGTAYVLDRGRGRVYRHRPGTDALELVVDRPEAAHRWSRVAVDRSGRIYVLDAAVPRLDVFDRTGQPLGAASDVSAVVDRFEPPAVRLDHKNRFRLGNDGVFDRHGHPAHVEPAEPAGPRRYRTAGTWMSEPLDSKIYRCQWHRVEIELGALPPGAQVALSTYADDVKRPNDEIFDDLWQPRYTITGPMQASRAKAATDVIRRDVLVQSREGQFLWIRLELSGDGYDSPAVSGLRVHYPRESYLSDLPAVFQSDDQSRWFLQRFLSIVQTEWDALEARIDEMPRLFDPRAVPGGPFLDYLAQWLAVPAEGTWNAEQRRNLLVATPRIAKNRGTAESLREHLRVYLANAADLAEAEAGATPYPMILEGFRERAHLMLSQDGAALGGGVPLWSAGVVGRLQLDTDARAGEAKLVSTGDPERDVFHEYAHRFRVFVPAAWVRSSDDERKLRRAVDAEKPAHARYDLCLVEPRCRVGLQSTVGIDTVIGAWPVAHLACGHDADAPPSREPQHRLGHDMILAGAPGESPTPRLAPTTRLGLDTTLA